MTPELVAVVVVLLLASALVGRMAFPPAALFVVVLENGFPRGVHGRPPPGFLEELADIAAAGRVRAGEVRGVAAGRNVRLWFSPNLPPGFRQRVRNYWVNSGLSARKAYRT